MGRVFVAVIALVAASLLLLAGVSSIAGIVLSSGCCGIKEGVQGMLDSLDRIGSQPAQLPPQKEKIAYQRTGPCKLELEKCSYDEDCCAGLKCLGACVDPTVSEQAKNDAARYQAEVYARVNPGKQAGTQNASQANQTINGTQANQSTQNLQQETNQTTQSSQTQNQSTQTQNQSQQQTQVKKKVAITLFKDSEGREQTQSCVKNNLTGCTQSSPDGLFAVDYSPVGIKSAGGIIELSVETDGAEEYDFGFNYVADAGGSKNLVFQEAYSGWVKTNVYTISIIGGVGDGKYSIGTDVGGMKVQNKRLIAFVRVRDADGKNELGASSVKAMELGDDVTAIVYTIQ